MINGCLQKRGNVICQIAVDWVIKPSQLRDATYQFDERHDHKILEGRPVVGKIPEDIVADIDPLRHGKAVPVPCDELCEAVGSHEASIL